MPDGYFLNAPPPLDKLDGTAVPKLALTWVQGAGGIVSSLADLTTWERALYQGQVLPPPQQRQLESLVSEATASPSRRRRPGIRVGGSAWRRTTARLPEQSGNTRAKRSGTASCIFICPRMA
jgi:hypothetical protein